MSSLGGKNLPPDRAQLEQLSTEELKEIIRADAESTSGNDEDFIFTVLEVIEEREKRQPDYRPPDLDAAWERFQRYYNTPDGVGHSLFPAEEAQEEISVLPEKDLPMGRPARKWIVAVAAVIAALFAGAFTAQAAGIDIGGIFARWTDDVFFFEVPPTETLGQADPSKDQGEYDPGARLIPAWVPEGFEAGDQIVNDFGTFTEIYQTYHAGNGESFIIIAFTYENTSYISQNQFEKNDADVVQNIYNGEKIYLFSNSENNAAVYWGESIEVSVIGKLSFDELMQVFNSMGEDPL